MVLHASAQPGLGGRWVVQVRTAEGQQALFQGKLGGVIDDNY